MGEIFCLIRKKWVAHNPEEAVRQRILQHLITNCGFPFPLIGVEKAIKQMPHLTCLDQRNIPDRRVDIVSFGKGIHPQFDIYPLLTIECKAVKITSAMLKQVIGYNHYIQAPFICIVNSDEQRTGWYDSAKKEYVFIPEIPSYKQLITSISSAIRKSQ